MANKIYQMQYDDEIDRDIAEWLNSLPRSRKAEMVRNAIRFYLYATGEQKAIVPFAPVQQSQPVAPKAAKPKKRAKLPIDERSFNSAD
jgi:hypothetical protein